MTPQPPADHWSPASWTSRPAEQQPAYRDAVALERAVAELSCLPPIVVSWEIDALKRQIAEAQQGRRFVLQGGDCAESFADCESGQIARKLKILLQMSLVLLHGLKKPVVRVGRFAGQYAKPRSADTETRDGVTLPSYRGDLVNRPAFTVADREPDPDLLLRGYERAALTLNFVRALIDGGFADLHHPEYWDLGFMQHSPLRDQYRQLVASISDSLDFYEAMSGNRVHEASRAPFYASHEALHLLYEQAQSRYIERRRHWYKVWATPMRSAITSVSSLALCRRAACWTTVSFLRVMFVLHGAAFIVRDRIHGLAFVEPDVGFQGCDSVNRLGQHVGHVRPVQGRAVGEGGEVREAGLDVSHGWAPFMRAAFNTTSVRLVFSFLPLTPRKNAFRNSGLVGSTTTPDNSRQSGHWKWSVSTGATATQSFPQSRQAT